MEDLQILKEPLWKLFIKFVVPSVLAMVLVGIQGVVDGFFLGRYESVNAMSSVNVANPFMQLILGGCFLICIGMLSRMGRMIGANNKIEAQNSFKTGLIAVLIFAIVFLVLGTIFHGSFARLLGANNILYHDTSRYIFTLSFFIPFICLMLLCGFSCRLIEKPHLYLIATVFCLFTNITLDFIMIKVFKTGVVGAAVSTGISYIVGLLLVCIPFFKRRTIVHFFTGKFRFYALKEMLFNGSSEGVSYLALAISIFLFNRAFLHFAGEKGIAVFTVIHYITNFEELLMLGVADGIATIISCNYGAKAYKRVQQTLFWAVVLNAMIGIIIYAFLFFAGNGIMRIFIQGDNEILSMAVTGAKLYGIAFLFNGYNILQSSYYTALGHSLASVLISASRGLVFIVIGIFILPILFKINGVWLTLPFAEIVTIFVSLFIFIFYRKTKSISAIDREK